MQLYREGVLTEIDLHFARFVSTLAANDDADISLAAALVSNACGNGNICLDLSSLSEKTILEEKNGQEAVACPPIERWRTKLESSSVVGRPGDKFPLILDNKGRLYLYRYWDYEQKLTDAIKQRIHPETAGINFNLLKKGLAKLFPESSDGGVNWQKVASLTALLKRFCIISGGPGTGKTFTVAKILALLVEQFNSPAFKILLAAPTGKAAARLAESIKNAKDHLNCRQTVKNAIPQEALTIHRMLGTKSGSPYFRFNRENPLPAEVVVVDEASMVDLALMSKLVQALPDTAKLVLIGDKDQLASVEAGAVLGDICDRNNIHGFSTSYCQQILELSGENVGTAIDHCKPNPGLHDCIVNLTGSYRFGKRSGIGELSGSVNRGNFKKVRDLLNNKIENTISLKTVKSKDDFYQLMTGEIITGYREYLKVNDPHQALKLFTRFKLLCALKIGPFGADAVNRLAEQILIEKDLIRKDRLYDNRWYKGRPVLITSNDYNLGLFNGDIGITLPDHGSDRGELYVFFSGTDEESRRFSPYILPEHETVYAMTVHKSQGSEFENVLLILPDRDSPVLTRELIYTAITRARKTIKVLGTEAIMESAVSRKIERKSGLRDALWGV
ncbi:MAG: exodeoxyribonuclease V subunit alpha [Deltaproteobacteria bacterium]|nr:MAG: exodeoxyribonuclease V subunit alpha [Deltaproteobacteria bacterium]